MLNFAPLLFVDHVDLAGSLRRHEGLYDHGAPRILSIRYPRATTEPDDEEFVWLPTVGREKKWPQMSNFLARLKREAEKMQQRDGTPIGPLDLGLIFLEMLDAGTTAACAAESGAYIERYTRVHLALRTNPGALMVSGNEAFSPAPGWVTAVNVRAPCYMANMGQHPRVHLVLDWRRKEVADG